MSIYMSKKISVPTEVIVRCVSVNCTNGFIAIGGDQGYLRVIRIDNKIGQNHEKNVAASLATANNLTMNQVLEGHRAPVVVVSWNEKFKKLTSGDEKGNIIVWILVKSTWCEEMVNTRNSSVVRDVRWTSDGQKICIVYEDGDTIVGSVDGNRIWGKNLKGKLTCVEWSPDGRKLLFGMNDSEVHVYDGMGNHIKTLAYQVSESHLANISWYNGNGGFAKKNSPCLAVTFKDGKCLLIKDELGEDPLDLETGFTSIVTSHWNDDGTLIGILGSCDGSKCFLHVYNTIGQLVSRLSMPGRETTSFSWDRGSIRLGVGIDSYLYLANYRLSYKWCHLKDTVVFAHAKLHEPEDLMIFWDTKRDVATIKSEKNLLHIMGCDDFCCLVTQPYDDEVEDDAVSSLSNPSAFTLTLTNSIGMYLDSKVVDMPLKYFSMSSSHVCVTSESAFYVWQFKNIRQLSTVEVAGKKKAGIEKLLHIDDVASGVGGENIDWKKADLETDDQICCLCLSNNLLVVGRCSGILQVYILQNIMLQNKYTVKCKPTSIQLNCDSSCLSIIDDQNMLSFLKFGNDNRNAMSISENIQKKDVWSFLWAKDNPSSFVLMEKTKMQVFNNYDPEEAVTSSGYLCTFSDLMVTSIYLDDVMTTSRFGGELTSCREFMVVHEAKSLKDLRKIVNETGFEAGMKFAESCSHPKLWKIMANYALEKLDLKSAELCFARAKHLTGIRFVKKLSNLQNDGIRKAEIATFYSNFDEAEKLYLGMDRRDLAMSMRNKMGDYMKEVKLMEGGGWGRGDYGKQEAYNKLADYHADVQQWSRAAQYYREGQNEEKLISCYFALEDYEALKQMLAELSDNHPILQELGRRFTMVGMCQEAVQAYLKCNQVQQAIDACIQLNQWNVAIELGHAHNKAEVDGKLMKYMQVVMDTNKLFEAVELYKKSNHFLEAAKILFQIAELGSKTKLNPLQLKKMYILAALLVEKHHEHNKQLIRNKSKKKENEASLALKGLLEEGAAGSLDSRVLTQSWRCVEAYHFLMLAHRHLYKGTYEAAMITSIHLKEFDDILDPVDIYSLLALTSFACKAMHICSEAFTRLETLQTLSEEQRKMYEELAVEIFYKNMREYKPKEVVCSGCHVRIPYTCTLCPHCNTKFLSCIVSGRLINSYQAWCCPCCKRCAIEEEILRNLKACPMCHQSF